MSEHEKSYQVMPDLDDDTYERLKEDIRRHGVEEPIKVTPDGEIVDGHHRWRACKELGIDPTDHTVTVEGSADEQLHRAHRLNLLRRELDGSKREVVKQYLLEHPERLEDDTHAEIAADLGVSRSLITKISDDEDVQDVMDNELDTSEKKQLFLDYITENPEASLRDAVDDLQDDFDAKRSTLANWRKELVPVTFINNDFNLAIEDIDAGSIDAILTDPPYGPNAIETWGDLGAFAKHVLKPGGFLIAYSGQNYLPDVYERLTEHLQYIWQFAVIHESTNRHPNHAISIKHKPVLVFGHETKEYRGNLIQDVIDGGKREKDDHHWQQSLDESKTLLEAFTNEDDLICDPMCGSGTTAVACVKTDRRAILIDEDETAIKTAKQRVNEVADVT